MTVRIDLTFAASYGIELLGYTDEGALAFVTEGVARGAPAVALSVAPAGGDRWQGEFFGRPNAPSYVASTPDPRVVLVVAGGVGYLADVDEPARYDVVTADPIRDVVPAPEAGVLLCVGLTTLTALGPGRAVAWTSPRLVADGFSEVRVGSGVVVVRGRAPMAGSDVELVLDLRSGTLR